jgi:hypothetical protein
MPLFDMTASTCSEIEARLRLQRVPEIGSQRFHKLVAHFGTRVPPSMLPPRNGGLQVAAMPVLQRDATRRSIAMQRWQWPG